jgi:hypothetical protein
MPGWKTTLPLIGPAVILAVAGILWWLPGGGKDPARGGAEQKGEQWESVDFSSLKPGDPLPGWEVGQGTFQTVENEGRTMLAMQPEPMVEGKVRWSQAMTGGGAIRVRMQGARTRRAAPRFGVAFQGASEIQLRAVPGKDVLEIAVPGVPETVLASVPWTWQPERRLWLEFRAGTNEGGSLFEGRVWAEGDPRPGAPSIRYQSATPPGVVRAVLEGAPYALRPIYCDRIETLRFYR